jgi:hypothetical protein
MALKNLSSYHKGKTYKLEIQGLGPKSVAVLDKGDHKLQLQFDSVIQWFTNQELSVVAPKIEPQVKVKVPNPHFNPSVIKPVQKTQEAKPKTLGQEFKQVVKELEVSHWERVHGTFLKIFRQGMIEKGYLNVYQLNPRQLLELALKKIPYNNHDVV